MVVFVDDRENDLVKHKLIARMGDRKTDPKGAVEIKRLTVADYVMGDWGIEAKEINDLYHSILGHGRSRTIIGQLHDLQEAYENPVLVVYGTKLKPYIPGRARGPQVANRTSYYTSLRLSLCRSLAWMSLLIILSTCIPSYESKEWPTISKSLTEYLVVALASILESLPSLLFKVSLLEWLRT